MSPSPSWAELPEFDPPPDLWPRILALHRRRRQRRIAGAIAAGLFGTALAAYVLLERGPSADASLAPLQARSTQLENELAALVPAASRDNPARHELERIERALQRAYERGAAHGELAALWRQRNEQLGILLATRQQDMQVTRL